MSEIEIKTVYGFLLANKEVFDRVFVTTSIFLPIFLLFGGPMLDEMKEIRSLGLKNSRGGWSDGKRFLVEDIVVYGFCLIISLFFDHICALISHLGIYILFNQEVLHPYNFGVFQALGACFSMVQIIRKWIDLRYYV